MALGFPWSPQGSSILDGNLASRGSAIVLPQTFAVLVIRTVRELIKTVFFGENFFIVRREAVS